MGIGPLTPIVGFAALILGLAAVFVFTIFGALIGAFTGLVLEFVPVLGPAVKQGFVMVGIENPDLVSIGAMLGFVGGFFKSTLNKD